MAELLIFPSRAKLYSVLPKDGIGAELGVRFGDNAKILQKIATPRLFHLIDIWKGKSGWQRIREEWVGKPRVKIHRDTTEHASLQFADNYFDWIYVDADHQYSAVSNDLRTYHQKVKLGGLVLGHDFFNHPGVNDGYTDGVGVIRAVLECVADGLYEFLYLSKDKYPSYGLRRV